MKRSRLKLFKTTSLTISLLGVILILITIGVIAYIGVASLTSTVSDTVSSGASYDQITSLQSQYANTSEKYLSLNEQMINSNDNDLKLRYNEGKLKLSEAKTTISSLETNNELNDEEVKAKVESVQKNLKEVNELYNQFAS